MTTYYKLTSADGTTYGGMKWAPGVTNRAAPGECKSCSPTALHVYETPELAVMLAPIHGVSDYTRMFEVEVDADGLDVQWDKIGCAEVTCVRELPMPVVSTAARVRFAILCTLEVCDDATWRSWADRWLSGEDRSTRAAAAALAAAAARAAEAWAAAAREAWAAEAAEAAARAAEAAAAAPLAAAAARAAEAWAAETAARAAADSGKQIDFAGLARKAIADEAALGALQNQPDSGGNRSTKPEHLAVRVGAEGGAE